MRRTWMLAVALLFPASGCATVKPYQRQYLSLPGMNLDPRADPDGEAEQHMLESREGSSGGYGAVGGGCGCN